MLIAKKLIKIKHLLRLITIIYLIVQEKLSNVVIKMIIITMLLLHYNRDTFCIFFCVERFLKRIFFSTFCMIPFS